MLFRKTTCLFFLCFTTSQACSVKDTNIMASLAQQRASCHPGEEQQNFHVQQPQVLQQTCSPQPVQSAQLDDDIMHIVANTPIVMIGNDDLLMNNQQFPTIHGMVIPSLKQNGLYCGYYTLYNALSFLHPQQYARGNIEQFRQFFGRRLQQIKNLKIKNVSHNIPYDNLRDNELKYLVGEEAIVVVPLSAMFDRVRQIGLSLAQILESEEQTSLLQAFISQIPYQGGGGAENNANAQANVPTWNCINMRFRWS
jgi:hypothetical protein